MIRTGEQYLDSIRDGRRVLCAGEMIDDLTTHPKTRGYAQAIAEYYDMHHDPRYADAMTFVDEDGERWARHWFLPRTKEDLRVRREYHELVFRKWARGAMFTRRRRACCRSSTRSTRTRSRGSRSPRATTGVRSRRTSATSGTT